MYNRNEFLVLSSICDFDDEDKGIIKSKGIRVSELIEKTKLSYSTINNALNSFITEGLVEYGLKDKQARTYIITEKGLSEIEKCIREEDE